MSDCIFCQIINKVIPAEFVYEDDDMVAFLDVNPVHPGHALVMPKQHVEKFVDVSPENCKAIAGVIQKIMKSLTGDLGYDGVNLIQNNGAAAGQIVPHLHFHVIPRKSGDGFAHWHGQGYANGEAALWAAKMRAALETTDAA